MLDAYDQMMANPNGPIIDMTQNGEFIDPPKPRLGTIFTRVALFAVAVLILAVAFWMALFIVPVLLILGLIGYGVARYQMKRNGGVVMFRRF
jgi:uncharacterized membrane protein